MFRDDEAQVFRYHSKTRRWFGWCGYVSRKRVQLKGDCMPCQLIWLEGVATSRLRKQCGLYALTSVSQMLAKGKDASNRCGDIVADGDRVEL